MAMAGCLQFDVEWPRIGVMCSGECCCTGGPGCDGGDHFEAHAGEGNIMSYELAKRIHMTSARAIDELQEKHTKALLDEDQNTERYTQGCIDAHCDPSVFMGREGDVQRMRDQLQEKVNGLVESDPYSDGYKSIARGIIKMADAGLAEGDAEAARK